jgi:hypothetical protein
MLREIKAVMRGFHLTAWSSKNKFYDPYMELISFSQGISQGEDPRGLIWDRCGFLGFNLRKGRDRF